MVQTRRIFVTKMNWTKKEQAIKQLESERKEKEINEVWQKMSEDMRIFQIEPKRHD